MTRTINFFLSLLTVMICTSVGIRAQAPAKTAEQQYKNIQVFKGLPATELEPLMAFMSGSLEPPLVVVSVGGAGSIPGALLACLVLGAIDTAGRYLVPDFGEFFFYLAVIVIVCVFPRGLLDRARSA